MTVYGPKNWSGWMDWKGQYKRASEKIEGCRRGCEMTLKSSQLITNSYPISRFASRFSPRCFSRMQSTWTIRIMIPFFLPLMPWTQLNRLCDWLSDSSGATNEAWTLLKAWKLTHRNAPTDTVCTWSSVRTIMNLKIYSLQFGIRIVWYDFTDNG